MFHILHGLLFSFPFSYPCSVFFVLVLPFLSPSLPPPPLPQLMNATQFTNGWPELLINEKENSGQHK